MFLIDYVNNQIKLVFIKSENIHPTKEFQMSDNLRPPERNNNQYKKIAYKHDYTINKIKKLKAHPPINYFY